MLVSGMQDKASGGKMSKKRPKLKPTTLVELPKETVGVYRPPATGLS